MSGDAHSIQADEVAVPSYLSEAYWWAYLHPRAVQVFERQWLVNLILWGNFTRLREAALDALGERLPGRTLQIACVYGDLTERLLGRLDARGNLDVVDILPIQLRNLRRKLPRDRRVSLINEDSACLRALSASYDRALLFFLLHEQPEEVRRATVAEALRVVRPGGQLVIVDYHRPKALNPLFWLMKGVLRGLEPYALDLWEGELERWMPPDLVVAERSKRTMFRGLYQILRITI